MLQHPRSRVSYLDTCNRILHACPCNKLPNKVFMRLSVQFKVSTNCSIKTRNPNSRNIKSQNVNFPKCQLSKCQLPKSQLQMSTFFNFKVAYKEHPCIYMAGTVNLFSSFLSYCGHHLSCLAFS